MKKIILFLAFLGIVSFSTNAQIYVDANVVGGMNDGTSWANAYTSLQDALADACANAPVEIWVADGIYYPDEAGGMDTDNRSGTFHLCNNVTIYGGFAGGEIMLLERDFVANIAILSGDIDKNDTNVDGNFIAETSADIQGDNTYHVVTGSGTNNTAILDGFTITAGNATGSIGGGMYNDLGSPTINNSIFSGNEANRGGGMFNVSSAPTIFNTTFTGNVANDGDGGAMLNTGGFATPKIINSTFINNSANRGAGIYNISNNLSPVTVINSVFSGNNAVNAGGAVFGFNSSIEIMNSIISGNFASLGGGVYNSRSTTTIINTTLSGNAANNGGAIYTDESNLTSTNSIIWNNKDVFGIGTNGASIFIQGFSNTITITYSLVQNITDDTNNNKDGIINAANANYPVFVTPIDPNTTPTTAGNLRLGPGSPATNMGDNGAVPMDINDVDGDNDTNEPLPDLALNDRIQNNTVEMGAYEIPVANITIVKAITGDNADADQDFSFLYESSIEGFSGSFSLSANNSPQNQLFMNVPANNLVQIREALDQLPANWAFDGVQCVNNSNDGVINYRDGNDGSQENGEVQIDAQIGDDITCTWTNEYLGIPIFVFKYNDLNENGSPEFPEEEALEDWNFTLYDDQGNEISTGTTGNTQAVDGRGLVGRVSPGTYVICETEQIGWANSDPGNADIADPENLGRPCKEIILEEDDEFANVYFGNYPICVIIDIDLETNVICEEGKVSVDLRVLYTNPPNTGSLRITIDGNDYDFPITGISFQVVTVEGLVPTGMPTAVTASFTDDLDCSRTEAGVFNSPPPPPAVKLALNEGEPDEICIGKSTQLKATINPTPCRLTALSLIEEVGPTCTDINEYRVAFRVEGINLPDNFDELKIYINGQDVTANFCNSEIEPNAWLLLLCDLPSSSGNPTADVMIQVGEDCSIMVEDLYTIPDCRAPSIVGENEEPFAKSLSRKGDKLQKNGEIEITCSVTFQIYNSETEMWEDAGDPVMVNEMYMATFDTPTNLLPGEYRFRAVASCSSTSCENTSEEVTIMVLNVDCGTFPWRGNE